VGSTGRGQAAPSHSHRNCECSCCFPQECAAFHKRTGRIVKLLTVQEILDEEHVQKM
jgi:hypothetical protein